MDGWIPTLPVLLAVPGQPRGEHRAGSALRRLLLGWKLIKNTKIPPLPRGWRVPCPGRMLFVTVCSVLLPRDPIRLQPCPCPCPAEPRAAARPCPAGIKLFLGPASCFPAARACSKAINLCLWLQWPGTGRAVSALPAAAPEQGRIPLEPTTPEGSWSWRQLLTPLQTRD